MWENLKTQIREQIWDNEQVLKLRQKFTELDTQTQSYIVIGSFAGFVLLLVASFVALWMSASSLKSELAAVDEQIRFVQSSAARIEELKSQARTQGGDALLRDIDPFGPIDAVVQKMAQKALVPKAAVELGEVTENSVSLTLSKVSLRQLVRVLYMIENSQLAMDSLEMETKEEGFLAARMNVRRGPARSGR